MLAPAYPTLITRVIEPFAGGAAVSLALNPDRIILGDMAAGLMAFYKGLGSPAGRLQMVRALSTIDKLRAAARAAVTSLSDKEVLAAFASSVHPVAPVSALDSSSDQPSDLSSAQALGAGDSDAEGLPPGEPKEMASTLVMSLPADPKAAARRKASAVIAPVPAWLDSKAADGLLVVNMPMGLVQKCEGLWPGPLGSPQSIVGPDLVVSWRDKCHMRVPGLVAKGAQFTVEQLRDQLETALQAGIYTTLRRIYNNLVPVSPASDERTSSTDALPFGWAEAAWFAVRCLCYSAMFRYGPTGLFNVPYGGISYNARHFATSIAQFNHPDTVDFFGRCSAVLGDFGDLFEHHKYFPKGFSSGDFVFVDPPYDSAFSQYNADADFGRADQERLRDELLKLDCPWMMVIKNTPFILGLYQGKIDIHGRPLVCAVFSKNYQVNFRNRHGHGVEHLVVTNYPVPDQALRNHGGAFELLPSLQSV